MKKGADGFRAVRLLLFLALSAGAASASPVDQAVARARSQRMADDPQWLRLGHWKQTGWRGTWHSDAGIIFFLSSASVHNPQIELEAEIVALAAPDQPNGHGVRCRFPARVAWIREQLSLDPRDFPADECAAFVDWRRLMDAGAASLIFASSYMANPSSMFGHTFLRLERKSTNGDRLRDNTLNFSAETGPDSGVLFAFKGLFGLYPGKYGAMPYYMKIAEYNDVENRDLWEYSLFLSTAEVDRLVAHAWEMGQVEFPYYFFSKNCSYQLMPALEAAAPRLSLMPNSPAIVGPVDTLLAVHGQPGLAAPPVFRPSHATSMLQRRKLLDGAERAAAVAYAEGRVEEGDLLTARMPAERRALVLDAAQDRILYKFGFSPDVVAAVRDREHPILLRRAKLDVASIPVRPPAWAAPPEEGHLRHRLSLGAGAGRKGAFVELAWRPGYHDMLDRPYGYPPGAAIEGFSWRLRYDQRAKQLYVREARLVEILSIGPWDSWTRKPSWSAGTGLETAFELGKTPSRSLTYEGHAGTGLSTEVGERAILYGLVQTEGYVGAAFKEGFAIGAAMRGGAAVRVMDRLNLLLDGALTGRAFGDHTPAHRVRLGINYTPRRNLAVRAEGVLRGHYSEAGLYAVLYH